MVLSGPFRLRRSSSPSLKRVAKSGSGFGVFAGRDRSPWRNSISCFASFKVTSRAATTTVLFAVQHPDHVACGFDHLKCIRCGWLIMQDFVASSAHHVSAFARFSC
jgi:hypothetical protein